MVSTLILLLTWRKAASNVQMDRTFHLRKNLANQYWNARRAHSVSKQNNFKQHYFVQRVLAVIGERVVPRPAPCKFQIVDDKDAKYQWNNVLIICIKGSVTTSLCRFFGQEKKAET